MSGTPWRVFIARLAGVAVFDPNGDQVGRVRDVVVTVRGERTPPRVGTSAGITRAASVKSNASRRRSKVASVEPSSTTITSSRGYRSPSNARVDSTIPAASLRAGTTTVTGGVNGLEKMSS